jgi:hypothetical protein
MPIDQDDLTPNQRGRIPTVAELNARTRLAHSRFGRWSRPRAWATILVALLAVVVCYLLLTRAR